jgi:hypothetical protein
MSNHCGFATIEMERGFADLVTCYPTNSFSVAPTVLLGREVFFLRRGDLL